jgi:hypothetical protein
MICLYVTRIFVVCAPLFLLLLLVQTVQSIVIHSRVQCIIHIIYSALCNYTTYHVLLPICAMYYHIKKTHYKPLFLSY